MAEWSDGAIGLAALAFGGTVLTIGMLQWRGLDFTESNPFFIFGTAYLICVPGGIGFILLGVVILVDVWFSSHAFTMVVGGMGMLLNLLAAMLHACSPQWLQPAWQKRQTDWWKAEEAAGRRVRWSDRPDHLRYGPGVIRRRIDELGRRYRKAHLDLDQIAAVLRAPSDRDRRPSPPEDDPPGAGNR